MLPRILEPEVMDSEEEARDYDAMDHREVNREFAADFLAFCREALPTAETPQRILDVGTGTAQMPIELCRQAPHCRVIAIDLASEMLKLAERNVRAAGLQDRIELRLQDAKHLPAGDLYDAVISNSIVHHIPEPRDVLREMLRVLRPGGVLFVRDLLRPPDLATLDQLVLTYAGSENAHQQKMFRDSLHAALTLDELGDLLESFDRPRSWVKQTSDRHWTLAGVG